MKKIFTILLVCSFSIINAQTDKSNSQTRKFIEEADITQINKDYFKSAEFTSGIGESVSFIPVEAIDLKTSEVLKALQVDMKIKVNVRDKTIDFFKSSWIDISEIDEFITFLEIYVIPNMNAKLEKGKSTEYVFNSKELKFSFLIDGSSKKVSIFLKDYGVTDYDNYFWTQSQVSKIPHLIKLLKGIKE